MDDLFESTVEILLDAAFDDARWGDAFEAIDRLCGLNGGQFTALAANGDGIAEPVFAACWIDGDPHREIVADWVENYAAVSENVPRIGRLPAWRLTHNEELFTPAEKRSSPMYNEFQPKYDCRDQLAVVVDRPSDERPEDGCLFWTMANGEAGWGSDKLKRIGALLPHIRQSVRLRRELVAAEAHAHAEATALLERDPPGTVFLDRHGAIASANRTARRMLAARDGIHEWRGGLRAGRPGDDARLQILVSRALPRLGHVPAGGSMSVRRPAGLPLIVHVHPVAPRRADFGAERVAAAVLVRDPDAGRLDAEAVGDMLGLTAAESRVAVLVGQGRTVRDIARELDRSENTIRWTLKNVLSKTGAERQADLVRLLLRLPPAGRDV
ncbi:MAG: helix-turn-helix transcriptional regulator [Defluviicoccus sp.]|nr:helix-turn-helix transcriptional regulator [Defluviicoccus sp.]MDE0382876.1 helix-turn-helix transcriptional regulator [Defluviicoccus sp.]